jgi:metal-responsive CopG/Arc/MetJ family transcriptional regulator
MPKRKIAIAISEDVLVDLDSWVGEVGGSRSAVIQEATAEYVARARTHARDHAYRERALAALEDMAALAAEYEAENPGGPSSLEILRELRGTGSGSADR